MTRRLAGAVADSGPVLVLAGIAAAGSFTHIRDTATEHGQGGWMAWAVAVCIDLTCVMAARERQRDKRTARQAARLSWPTLVLVGGILLSLAANLAQAETSVWGWLSAATPAGAFLVAVSMLERRASGSRPAPSAVPSSDRTPVPPSFGHPDTPSPSLAPSSSPPPVPDDPRPELPAAQDEQDEPNEQDGQTEIPVPAVTPKPAPPASAPEPAAPSPAAPLLDFARRVADEHEDKHGRPITRDALRSRLGVSNQLASDLLRQIRADQTPSNSAA
ncbi:DUF2637 domain-containing protein [Spirillospora sp. CA-128828]|uniref:DUF2637 domain-containing protein n=1 Tax=Spirillospora sp. CA-128828 TaxID=3240033 RepID=UPI003D9365C6